MINRNGQYDPYQIGKNKPTIFEFFFKSISESFYD
jgi:hypothetical protein